MDKTTQKVSTKAVEQAEKKFEAPLYHLYVKINDKEFDFDTNDLANDILSTQPEIVRTKLVIKVTKGKKTLDRLLYANEAKRLYRNEISLEAFINNLFF